MEMKDSIAIIGHGYWGSKLLKYVPEYFYVKYVADSKFDKSMIWNDRETRSVIIATPIDTHYSIVKDALLHGKNVLCEKPLALKTERCLELKELSEKQGVALLTEYTWTFSKGLMKAQDTDIGTIKAIEMDIKHLGRFLKWDVYWLLASHMLSILDMFIPLATLEFKKIDFLKDRGLTETGMIVFKGGEVTGRINISINYTEKETKVVIYGTKGTIIYEPLIRNSLRISWYKKTAGLLAKDLLTETRTYFFDEMNNLKYAVEYFYKIIKGAAKTNINTAILITKVIESLVAGEK